MTGPIPLGSEYCSCKNEYEEELFRNRWELILGKTTTGIKAEYSIGEKLARRSRVSLRFKTLLQDRRSESYFRRKAIRAQVLGVGIPMDGTCQIEDKATSVSKEGY